MDVPLKSVGDWVGETGAAYTPVKDQFKNTKARTPQTDKVDKRTEKSSQKPKRSASALSGTPAKAWYGPGLSEPAPRATPKREVAEPGGKTKPTLIII